MKCPVTVLISTCQFLEPLVAVKFLQHQMSGPDSSSSGSELLVNVATRFSVLMSVSICSEESQTIRLNCFILGDGTSFHIDIAPTTIVDTLQSAIKDEYKNKFANVGAANIVLWNVSIWFNVVCGWRRFDTWKVDLPLNEESKRSLKSFKTDIRKSLFSLKSLIDIFGSTPANDRLHVVVLPSESSITIATLSSILILVSTCS